MDIEVRINIEGQKVSLTLFDIEDSKNIRKTKWVDRRSLSSELPLRLETALRKSGLAMSDVKNFDFVCDSPYFDKNRKDGIIRLEEMDSSGKCGFTAWQTGEIFTDVMNFALK